MLKRFGGNIGYKDKNSLWDSNGFPYVSNTETLVYYRGEIYRGAEHYTLIAI